MARRFRMAFFRRENYREFQHISQNLSDFSLFNGIYKYFTQNNGNDYMENYKDFMRATALKDNARLRTLNKGYEDQARRLLIDSGYGLSYIDKNLNIYTRELKHLYTNPQEMRF